MRSRRPTTAKITEAIVEAVSFLETIAERPLNELSRMEFFTSHEGLHLDYEQAQTRQVPRREGWYNLTTHFPWIGDRTRDLDGAHVEYFRGIANPIGVKVGPTMSPEELLALVERLNPARRTGPADADPSLRGREDRKLPAAAGRGDAARRANGPLVLRSDARQHDRTDGGLKTRSFDDILERTRSGLRHPPPSRIPVWAASTSN